MGVIVIRTASGSRVLSGEVHWSSRLPSVLANHTMCLETYVVPRCWMPSKCAKEYDVCSVQSSGGTTATATLLCAKFGKLPGGLSGRFTDPYSISWSSATTS